MCSALEFTFRQLLFYGIADLALPGQRLELRQGAFDGFIVFGQLRVGVVQVTVEVNEGEFQPVFVGAEVHGRAEDFVPLMRVFRFRPTQVNRQRGIVAAQAIAAGTHVNRHERIDGLVGRGRMPVSEFSGGSGSDPRCVSVPVQGVTGHLNDTADNLQSPGPSFGCLADV